MFSSFSVRAPDLLAQNRLAGARERLKDSGIPVLDLTASNPTTAGFEYPLGLMQPLGSADGLRYHPEPLGLETARETVAAHLRRHDLDLDTAYA